MTEQKTASIENIDPKSRLTVDSERPSEKSLWTRCWETAQFMLSIGIAVATLAFLAFQTQRGEHDEAVSPKPAIDVVQLDDQGRIRILVDSTLEKKLQIATVQKKKLTIPITTVTGRVIASYRGGAESAKDSLQFDSAELLTSYTDWQKAVADVTFLNSQLTDIRELAAARIAKQENVVGRLTRLVAAGTDTTKDLDAAKTDLLEAQISGRKEVFAAETEVRKANRSESSLARQLLQAGLDPELLGSMTLEDDLVVGEVPEARMHLIRQGQACEARFVAVPKVIFKGTVTSVSPVLTADRRTLRVLFTLKDPEDKLRPGMFSEIGLGTDAHEDLVVPLDGVLHVGRSDYLLKEVEPHVWEVVEVQVGELRGADVHVLSGAQSGDRVLGSGAILLKPFVIRALNVSAAVQSERAQQPDAQPKDQP